MNAYLGVAPGRRAGEAGHPGAPLRLFCFHHAGAGALTFARWKREFTPDVHVLPVRLPGRETRLREPRITEGPLLLDELDTHLGPLLEEPYAFYGHSLGALVAYRFAQYRQRTGQRGPALVGLGACPPPHLPTPLTEHRSLSDEGLLAALNRYGTLPSYLFERPRWLSTLLSTTRDDLHLAASLREGAGERLTCPVHAFAGTEDEVATASAVAEWRRYTSGPFALHTVPGGHFFVREAVLPELLAAELRHRTRPHPRPANNDNDNGNDNGNDSDNEVHSEMHRADDINADGRHSTNKARISHLSV
ncbi:MULTISPECIES: thioesterase domain-containing protein [unclassified Streptomyces]|uniref:thioesterase II family protein n=1 Tax=unclassified Streptomyces TaxID=2593676 RepID=UPI002DDBDA98|nr:MULTISPECIES: thioesterase domain-containing protein [unclassified Streptomyces]WSA95457.1 thioesterase domain-containing protein [Streptomyces sp. NBC_01795]WSB79873.1 thioesterase domain-containing protein [Streptomyces sp. NBC_01775]WSS11920.1 thioesterase domain-containing protein [Streptomyces sp. NBC_01186]WSS40634.1 thioesterase domain-containing protein [Streptomyces sp. NBC_01187]